MNDRRMGELVRMAMEVDGLEREASAGTPRLRLVGAEPDDAHRHTEPTRGWWIGMSAAAAAILAMAAALPFMLSPSANVPQSTGIAEKPEAPVDAPTIRPEPAPIQIAVIPPAPFVHPAPVTSPVDAGSIEKCVVVAIYRDNRGVLNCVTPPTTQVWQGNKCLSEVSAQELKTMTLEPCTKESNRGLVVAMAGPQRSLPKTESDAFGLAACILGGPNDGQGLTGMATAAASCVPPEVAVKIEAIGAR